jgi:hypothetical protein
MTGAAREKYTDLLLALSMLNSIGNELVKSGEGTGLVLGGTDERDSLLENRSLDGGASNVVKNILTSVGADSITTSVESSLLSNVDLVKTRNGLLAGSVVSLEGVSRGGSSVGLNESLMDTVSVMFVGYVLGADKISEAIKEFRCDYVNHLKDTFTAKKDLLKAQMEICQSKINTPAVTADIHKAFVEANAAAATANALKAHHAAREKTVSRLNQIYVAEQATLNARRDAVRTNARQYVLDNVAGAPIKASVLKEAISLVGATEDKTGTFAALDKLVADAVKHAKSKQ